MITEYSFQVDEEPEPLNLNEYVLRLAKSGRKQRFSTEDSCESPTGGAWVYLGLSPAALCQP